MYEIDSATTTAPVIENLSHLINKIKKSKKKCEKKENSGEAFSRRRNDGDSKKRAIGSRFNALRI